MLEDLPEIGDVVACLHIEALRDAPVESPPDVARQAPDVRVADQVVGGPDQRAGRDDDAARLLERLQAGYERVFAMEAWARSFYLLGQIYERRGDTARAREQYARFLDLWRDGDLERGWIAEAEKKLK